MASLYKLWFKTKDTIEVSIIIERDNLNQCLEEGKHLQDKYGVLTRVDNIYSDTKKERYKQERL